MKTPSDITRVFLPLLLVFILTGCVPSVIPQDVADERLIDVGLPFERGLMAYIRGDEELARTELQEAVNLNHQDQRASYLLCHLDNNDCYSQSLQPQQEAEQPIAGIRTVEQYLALVEGRSPSVRNSVYAIVEQKMILEQKQYGVGPVLNIMLRFYPEAIFAMLTQRLVELVEHPSEMNRQNALLLQKIASYVEVKDDVLTRAFNSYVDFGTAAQQMHALRAELAAREHMIRITRLLIDSGYTVKSALVEVEAKRDKTLQQLQSVETRLLSYRQRMAVLAGTEPEQFTHLTVQHLTLPETEETPTLRTSELEAIASQQYFDSLDVSDTISVLSLTKVNLFASYGKNYANERVTFVRGWATGVRFQVPLMIWPLSNARIAQQDAVIGQLETELEYTLIQTRNDWLDTYKKFTEASSLYANAQSDVAVRKQRLQSQESAHEAGAPSGRLQSIQSYISYYRSLYIEYDAASRQQKAAYQWFRAQALSSRDTQFSVFDLSLEDTCQVENRYVYPPNRTLEVSETSSFTDADKSVFLQAFASFNKVSALVVPASSYLLTKYDDSYRDLLGKARDAGFPVFARFVIDEVDKTLPLPDSSLLVKPPEKPDGEATRFDGIKLVFSNLLIKDHEQVLRSVLADYRQFGLPVVVELEYGALAAQPKVLAELADLGDKVSVFINPNDTPEATELMEMLGAVAAKTYFTIDLGAYRRASGSPQLPARGMENLVQEYCRLFRHQKGLRELGVYSFEDYMALMTH
jgi:hypothetical protein